MKKYYLYISLALFIFFQFVAIDATQAQQLTIIAIGDSLTQGVGDNQYQNDMTVGYPGRLKNMLVSQYDLVLHNLGIPGYDSSDVIENYNPSETSQLDQALRLISDASNSSSQPVTLVWVGSNYLWAVYDWKCNTESQPSCTDDDLSAYSANIETILSRLSATESIVLIALQDDHSKRPVVSDDLFSESRATITQEEQWPETLQDEFHCR